jgi:hypothetical protein
MRMHIHRFTRLTNPPDASHDPAMAAGVTGRLWETGDIGKLASPKRRATSANGHMRRRGQHSATRDS